MKSRGSLAKDWEGMSTEAKSQFIKENQNLYGSELQLKVTDTVNLWKVKESRTSFKGEGQYKTEQAIREAYKAQPEIADNIIAKGRKFMDEVKGVWLYEDTTYTATHEDTEVVGEDRRARIVSGPNMVENQVEKETGTENKGPKKRKGQSGQEPGNSENTNAKAKKTKPKASKADQNFAKKFISALAPQKLELAGLKEKSAGKEHLIPAHVLTFASQTLSKIEASYSQIEPIFKGEKTVEEVNADRSAFEAELKGMVQEGSMAIERLRVQVTEVERWGKTKDD